METGPRLTALEQYLARDQSERIAPYGRSIVLNHGSRTPWSAVLLHGLSASPKQFDAIANLLFERGYNVFTPRLPRHGYEDRSSASLSQMRAEHLRAAASDALAAGRELGEKVLVVGFSLGGLLAVHLVQSERVDRAVAIAPFLGFALFPNRWRRIFMRLALRAPNYFGWWDPLRRDKTYPEHGYPRWSSHALAHAMTIADELFNAAKNEAPKSKRITLIANAREAAVNNRAIDLLAQTWRAHSGVTVDVRRLTSLPYSHDIIETLRPDGIARRALPELLDIIVPEASESDRRNGAQ
ncbi:MAG: alpha/beta fold hydrolase [Candidatus Eremiobacteraeota bacterium]|nr:alpha/beta fold hydrolase [Candidatus Eremiobacteraeota bacterium]